jgi:hypothetical protein
VGLAVCNVSLAMKKGNRWAGRGIGLRQDHLAVALLNLISARVVNQDQPTCCLSIGKTVSYRCSPTMLKQSAGKSAYIPQGS